MTAGHPFNTARRMVQPRALAALGGLLLAALISGAVLLGVHWTGPVTFAQPQTHFAVGPLYAGEAVEQTFQSEATYLSRITVSARSHGPADRGPWELVFRLYRGAQLVREGMSADRDLGPDVRHVTWEFAPIADSAGMTYVLQVVAGPLTVQPVYLMATLSDTYPGAIVTNGVPSASHVDLALVPARDIMRTEIVRAVSSALPGGVPALAVLLAVLTGAVAFTLRGRSIVLRPLRSDSLAAWVVGAAAVAVAFSLAVLVVSYEPAPERSLGFWLRLTAYSGLATALGVGSVAQRVVSKRLGRRSEAVGGFPTRIGRAIAGPGGFVLLAAIAFTLAATGLMPFSEEPPLYTRMEIFAEGRPAALRIASVSSVWMTELARAAIVLWIAYAATRLVGAGGLRGDGTVAGAMAALADGATAARGAAAPRLVYGLLFAGALLIRYPPFLQGAYSPWWDGTGLGHHTGWIDEASRLALHADVGLFTSIHGEGWVFSPLLAALFKLFGIPAGLNVWGHASVFLSAAIAVIAASTAFRVTRRPVAAGAAGLLALIDPISAWFMTNGWSDATTLLGYAVTVWVFVWCAGQPSTRRMVVLGVSLAILGFSHGTWVWPAVWWAAMAAPLVRARHTWLTGAEPLPPLRSWRSRARLATPLVTVLAIFGLGVVAIWLWVGRGGPLPIFGGGAVNLEGLASVAMGDGAPAGFQGFDVPKAIVGGTWAELGAIVERMFDGNFTVALPGYAWIVTLVGIALATVAFARRNARLTWGGIPGIGVAALLAFVDGGVRSNALPTLLVVGLLFLFVPWVRAMTVALAIVLVGYTISVTDVIHYRHSNQFLYVLIIGSGMAVACALDWIRGAAAARFSRPWERAGRAGGFAILSAPIVWGAISTATAAGGSIAEARALHWIGTKVPLDGIVLVGRETNPWAVQQATGRTVIWPADSGGWQRIDPGWSEWGPFVRQAYGWEATTDEIVAALRAEGRSLWFYRTGITVAARRVQLVLGSEDLGEFPAYALVPIERYPEDVSRALLRVGERLP